MPAVRVAAFSLSLDGFGAGPDQQLDHPLGVRGLELHDWLFRTSVFDHESREASGADPIDEKFAWRAKSGFGAYIMGRNMFGPIRDDWGDEQWKGWWGDNPPFHGPTYVLTHHPRASVEMDGGTTFHFITGGIELALARAFAAANGADVRIGGGVETIRQYLRAGLINELHLAIVPIVLGRGEALFNDLDLPALGYSITDRAVSSSATHVVLSKTG